MFTGDEKIAKMDEKVVDANGVTWLKLSGEAAGEFYYYNESTGESTWEIALPAGGAGVGWTQVRQKI